MSYCRWSTDDFQCDVYVYESDRGFETHVASHKYLLSDPLPPAVDLAADTVEQWLARRKQVAVQLAAATKLPLPVDVAGKTFIDDTPGDCAERLKKLATLGLNIPSYAIDDLLEEQLGFENEDQ